MRAKDVKQRALLSLTSEKHLVEDPGTKPPQPGGRGTIMALRVQVGAPPEGD